MAVEIPATVILGNVEIEAGAEIYTPEITTDDYSALANKPSINGVVLIGDKSAHDLHLADLDDLYNYYPTDTASGSIASFEDGAEDVPVKSLSVTIEPVQSGTGDPSPSNIRPISGHTQAVVTRTGEGGADSEQYTISLDGTRYGGTLDVTNGVLTLTHGYADLGSLTWTEVATTRLTVGSYHRATIDGQASSADRICSNYKLLLPAGLTDLIATWGADIDKVMFMAGGSNAKYVYIIDSSYADATAFKTAMDGVDYVYLLATPLTVQLTPTEVTTLLGDNNIFCSTGDTEVTYRADMGLFIRKVIGGG